jgi:hypothetical protein
VSSDEVKSKAEWRGADIEQAQGYDKWRLKASKPQPPPSEHKHIQPIKEQ